MILELVSAAAVAAPPPVTFRFNVADAAPGAQASVSAQGRRLARPVRLYVVRSAERGAVRSELDPRLAYLGTLRPRSRPAAITFVVPPLASGDYVAWCARCEPRTIRPLRVTMPAATSTTCPVTKARGDYYGHDLLQTALRPAGVLERRPEADGSIFDKLPWIPPRGVAGKLSLVGTRLDAPGRLRVLAVNWGYSSDGRGSWATAVKFPEPGCWKLRARMRPYSGRFIVDLAYVLKVVRG